MGSVKADSIKNPFLKQALALLLSFGPGIFAIGISFGQWNSIMVILGLQTYF